MIICKIENMIVSCYNWKCTNKVFKKKKYIYIYVFINMFNFGIIQTLRCVLFKTATTKNFEICASD